MLPCGKTLLWIPKAAEIPVSLPTVFAFLGSLALTNYLLCLLEIGGTFLTTVEALCVTEPFEEVREGAFAEQTRLTLHHNLQTELLAADGGGDGDMCHLQKTLAARR